MNCTVLKIRWERVLLHLDVKVPDAATVPDAFLEDIKSGRRFPMKAKDAGTDSAERTDCEAEGNERICTYSVNITNPGTCRCLPDGSYRVILIPAEGTSCEAVSDCDAEGAGKEFPFNSWKDCCTYSFSKTPFRIRVRTEYRSPYRHFRKVLIRDGATALYRLMSIPYVLPVRNRKKKKVLFLSGQAASPGENLTAVSDRMKKRGLAGGKRGFDILESYRDRSSGPRDLMRALRRIAAADYIFLDDHEPLLDYVLLRKSTVLVQLWHAGVGFKSSGYSRFGCPGGPAPFMCHRQYTWGTVSSKAVIPIYSEIWGINDNQVLPVGIPRMDRYLDPAHRAETEREMRKRFPLTSGKRVILFAPTYRGKGKQDADYPFEKIDFRRLYEVLGTDSVILFRMHPWVKRPVPIPESMRDRMADAGTVSGINDLFYITDLLITDYSSAICEFSLMDRPMLFYAFDEEEYAASRGFHRDYETFAPGKVCRTFDDLLDALEKRDFEQEKALRYVKEQFDRRDTGACDRIIDQVLLGKKADI